MFDLIDILQQSRINDAAFRAKAADDRARTASGDAEDLRHRVERLTLACQALWELLRERLNVSDTELMDVMRAIDLRDGHADGRIGHSVVRCEQCQRPNSGGAQACVYCGASIAPAHVFRS